MRKAILECRGPLITTKDAGYLFSSAKRPNADVVRGAMANLVKDALGETAQVGKSLVFFKTMPEKVNETNLEIYRVDIEVCSSQFWKAPADEKKREDVKKYLKNRPNELEIVDRLGV